MTEPAGGFAHVPFPPDLTPVYVVARRNRFTVEATLKPAGGTVLALHLPNSGRMTELLQPGTLGLAALAPDAASRRTAGTLLLVRYARRWVSVDARMPNRLFARCLEEEGLPPFRGYPSWRAEVRWGQCRVDFLLEAPGRPPCLVETKSCNLVEDGLALFPDAPTTRGTRHLLELAAAVQEGYRAAVVWFVQRDDAAALAPHRTADPDFAHALAHARSAGVEAYAYRCRVDPGGVRVLGPIPVRDQP
ncbi:MAG: DNA/RNA nuclease SfsA [Limnochordales bacterium]|nr:DNA/RNA nuclease SfsA [Limnochordales bacterium]